jgi:hypothetical protein
MVLSFIPAHFDSRLEMVFFSETETERDMKEYETNVLYMLSKVLYKNINMYKARSLYLMSHTTPVNIPMI